MKTNKYSPNSNEVNSKCVTIVPAAAEIFQLQQIEKAAQADFGPPSDDQSLSLMAQNTVHTSDFYKRLAEYRTHADQRPIYVAGLLDTTEPNHNNQIRHLAVGQALGLKGFTYVDENRPKLADRQSPRENGVENSNETPNLHLMHMDLSAGAPWFHPTHILLTAEYNPFNVSTLMALLPDVIGAAGPLFDVIEPVLREKGRFRHLVSPSFGVDHPGVVHPVLAKNEYDRDMIFFSSYSTTVEDPVDEEAAFALGVLKRAIDVASFELPIRTGDCCIFPQDFAVHGRVDATLPNGQVKPRTLIRTYWRRHIAQLRAVGGINPYGLRYTDVISGGRNVLGAAMTEEV